MNYIIHPYTKEIQKEENYEMFKDWQRTKFIKATAEQEEQDSGNGYFELTLTLEDGSTKTTRLTIEQYFDGKSFYLN